MDSSLLLKIRRGEPFAAADISQPWVLELAVICQHLSDPGNPITDEQRGFFGRLGQALELCEHDGLECQNPFCLGVTAVKPKLPSGKQDPGYLDTIAERKRLLLRAFELQDGSVGKRCVRIACDIEDFCDRIKAGKPPVLPNEYEQIILDLSSGKYGKPLATDRGVRMAIFRDGEK